jgi:gas vesicle protein
MRAPKLSSIGLFAGGAIVGARLMYLFDPDRGRSRRVRLRDKAVRAFHLLGRQGNKQIRNVGNHLIGRLYELRSSIRDRSSEISDDILLDRVRAQLGRDVRHLRMLDFRVENGCVVVEGPALRGEAHRIRERLQKTRGVRDCDVRVQEVQQEELERLSGRRGTQPQRMAM